MALEKHRWERQESIVLLLLSLTGRLLVMKLHLVETLSHVKVAKGRCSWTPYLQTGELHHGQNGILLQWTECKHLLRTLSFRGTDLIYSLSIFSSYPVTRVSHLASWFLRRFRPGDDYFLPTVP